MKQENGTAAVEAAKAGDEEAREQLVAAHLPLIYNVVGRALDGHADVDDVVQETMLRVLESLADLREPASFRSWLVAIAMNQVRRRWTTARKAPLVGLDQVQERADHSADFVDLTILKLGLSGQRREVAAATRWLDERDRALLSLWWLEAAGEITRPELVAAIGIDSRHAAVRVQRMKEQLEAGRVVVRALSATPLCPELSELTATWDHEPCPLWRKRIARHARQCRDCAGHWDGLLPAEGLLVGLALLPLPSHLTPETVLPAPAAATAQAAAAPPQHTSGASHHVPQRPPRSKTGPSVAGTATLVVAVGAAVWWWSPGTPPDKEKNEPKATRTVASRTPSPHPTPTPTPTPSRSKTAPPHAPHHRPPPPRPPRPTSKSRPPHSSTSGGRRPAAGRCASTSGCTPRRSGTPPIWRPATTTSTRPRTAPAPTHASPPPATAGAAGARTSTAAHGPPPRW